LLDFIDWDPFFQTWQIRGKYPNRHYPKLFNDPDVGVEAKKLHTEALAMLKTVVEKKLLTANGIVGFYPAQAQGDDIHIYTDESRSTVQAKFFGLRQQQERVRVLSALDCQGNPSLTPFVCFVFSLTPKLMVA